MLIYAHRGGAGEFPEGSLQAYLGAIKAGSDGFECDLRLTKDEQIICYHDPTTKRLSKLDLKIANTTLAQLKEQVDPLGFVELLELAISNKKDLVIEFKHPVPSRGLIEKKTHQVLNQYAEQIKSSGIKIYLISFSFLSTLRNKKSSYQTGFLINRKYLARVNPSQVVAANLEIIKADHNFVSTQKKRGRKVMVWTVNEPEDLILCKKLGIDAVITDYPARARLTLGYS